MKKPSGHQVCPRYNFAFQSHSDYLTGHTFSRTHVVEIAQAKDVHGILYVVLCLKEKKRPSYIEYLITRYNKTRNPCQQFIISTGANDNGVMVFSGYDRMKESDIFDFINRERKKQMAGEESTYRYWSVPLQQINEENKDNETLEQDVEVQGQSMMEDPTSYGLKDNEEDNDSDEDEVSHVAKKKRVEKKDPDPHSLLTEGSGALWKEKEEVVQKYEEVFHGEKSPLGRKESHLDEMYHEKTKHQKAMFELEQECEKKLFQIGVKHRDEIFALVTKYEDEIHVLKKEHRTQMEQATIQIKILKGEYNKEDS